MNATRVAGDLREFGFQSYHSLQDNLYNVVAGGYESYEEAQFIGEQIAEHGYGYHIPR